MNAVQAFSTSLKLGFPVSFFQYGLAYFSLLAAIGQVIEDHMTRSGFLVRSAPAPELGGARAAIAVGEPRGGEHGVEHGRGKLCPRCSALSLHRREGCLVCDSCGYSKCG